MIVICGAGSGCAPHMQYRTQLTTCSTVDDPRACADYFIEESGDYSLGFVEFDDQGWFWDREQMDRLIDRLSFEVSRRDVLMVVFAHGWKHNAEACDTNVSCFRESLRRVHALEVRAAAAENRVARKIFGIYLGWRGLSMKGEWLTNLTFWDRKNTAHQVGSAAVTELLVRLNSIRYIRRNVTAEQKPSPTQLIIVGHSFGGAVIYSAVSQLLIDRFIDYRGEGVPPEPFGDLVILINPAFEAKRYETLHQMALRRTYLPGQAPILAIITSEGDDATGTFFPIGRRLSTAFEKQRDADEAQANRSAVGHFARYRTHTLKATANNVLPQGETPVDDCHCPFLSTGADAGDVDLKALADFRKNWSQGLYRPGWEQAFPGAVLRHDPSEETWNGRRSHPLNPMFVIATDNEIINGHNDIYRPVFVDFIRYFMLLATPEGKTATSNTAAARSK